MRFVPAICTQCGSILEIDPSKEAAICPYCNTPFITEKAINNYNTTNVTNVHADVVEISDLHARDRLAKAGKTFLAMKDYDKARENFIQLCQEYPYDYRGWWGLIEVITKNFENLDITRMELIECNVLYERALEVASAEEKSSMEMKYKSYYDEKQSMLDILVNNSSRDIKKIEAEYEKAKRGIEECIKRTTEEKAKIKDHSGTVVLVLLFAVLAASLGVSLYDGSSFFLGLLFFGVIAAVIGFIPYGIAESIYSKQKEAKEKQIDSLKNQLIQLKYEKNLKIGEFGETRRRAGYPKECAGFSLGEKMFLQIDEKDSQRYNSLAYKIKDLEEI